MSDRDRITEVLLRATPYPRPDPRRRQYTGLEREMGNPELDQLLMGAPQRSQFQVRAAGPEDDQRQVNEIGEMYRGVGAMADPERFEQAWRSWAPSQNIENREAVTPMTRDEQFKDLERLRVQGYRPQFGPDVPGWEWLR